MTRLGEGLDNAAYEVNNELVVRASRAAFYARCSLLEDVAYGLSTSGAYRYAEGGLAHLARTFA